MRWLDRVFLISLDTRKSTEIELDDERKRLEELKSIKRYSDIWTFDLVGEINASESPEKFSTYAPFIERIQNKSVENIKASEDAIKNLEAYMKLVMHYWTFSRDFHSNTIYIFLAAKAFFLGCLGASVTILLETARNSELEKRDRAVGEIEYFFRRLFIGGVVALMVFAAIFVGVIDWTVIWSLDISDTPAPWNLVLVCVTAGAFSESVYSGMATRLLGLLKSSRTAT